MKISSRADYAAKAMLELSINHDRPVTLSYLARLQDISISYLEQIFYILNRPMDEISVGDIVRAIDNIASLDAGSEENDRTHRLWRQLSTMVYGHLDTISLADIHQAADKDVHQAA